MKLTLRGAPEHRGVHQGLPRRVAQVRLEDVEHVVENPDDLSPSPVPRQIDGLHQAIEGLVGRRMLLLFLVGGARRGEGFGGIDV